MRSLKRNRIIFALAAVCALFIDGVATSFQQQPRDVVDYYLLLPDPYLTLGGGAQERDNTIKISATFSLTPRLIVVKSERPQPETVKTVSLLTTICALGDPLTNYW